MLVAAMNEILGSDGSWMGHAMHRQLKASIRQLRHRLCRHRCMQGSVPVLDGSEFFFFLSFSFFLLFPFFLLFFVTRSRPQPRSPLPLQSCGAEKAAKRPCASQRSGFVGGWCLVSGWCLQTSLHLECRETSRTAVGVLGNYPEVPRRCRNSCRGWWGGGR